MMVLAVLLLTLLSGLLVLLVRGVGWSMRFGTVHFCLGLPVFSAVSGNRFQLLLSVLRILLFGLTLLVFLVNCVSFLNSLHWPVGDLDLVRDFLWRKLTLVIFVQGAQFLCRLFLLVQALIFGARVGYWCSDAVSLHVAWSWSFRALLCWC